MRKTCAVLRYDDSGTGKTALVRAATRLEGQREVSLKAVQIARGASGKSEARLWLVLVSAFVRQTLFLLFFEVDTLQWN